MGGGTPGASQVTLSALARMPLVLSLIGAPLLPAALAFPVLVL